ncbi:MAG TPA: hypothetical protein VGE01_08140 [Fimbriimonas sp.]
MKRLSIPAMCLLAVCAYAQDPAADGAGGYPQFRNISGLPGGGFGVRPDGTVGISGALALTTPIAYSLRSRYYVAVAGAMSFDMTPRFNFDDDDELASMNGTAALLGGFSSPNLDLTVGGLLLSSIGDTVLNLHASPTKAFGGLRFGVGVQDVFNTGGEYGHLDPRGPGDSRSIYGVVTHEFAESRVYASLGIGSNRFNDGFGNVSVPLGDLARGYLEYDGKWVGFGAAYGAGNFTLLAGVTDGKYLVYSAAYRF